ncbi:hypothetical protein ASD21_08540 [Caulobacter sp. Root1455]|uniref:hypothetical protein n=1 Tax=Caulobacter sp. Root1455 TaxID=1736465 RepID=UPI0007144F77|nr:hypothetical protein [Caulobacter sp. Root1455]KQY95383.1 hypothetical protein ASD21_08540 [Caulobacter sp. Root1455]
MRKRSMTLAVAAVSILLAPQALAPRAQAFGTIRALGQNAEHERITRSGLASFGFGPQSLGQLAGANGTWGAVGMPDNPDRGLSNLKAAHCDGGDFFDAPGYPQSQAGAVTTLTACRTYVITNINAAVTDAAGLVKPNLELDSTSIWGGCIFNGAKGRAKCNVFEDMGLVFHAAQDFYSHSNWTDAPRGAPSIDDPQGLNHTAPALWLAPGGGGVFPSGLISGCYEGFPEFAHCPGRIKHAVLNKDTTGTARGMPAYTRAMSVAAQDTRNKWTYLEKRLVAVYGAPRGNKMICVLKRDDPASC